ncbi:hypothetical protein L7F22_011504 [Adiantum nelumboides]|nr:hypothetical protein [Adiantum nelumboides]
MADQRRRSSWPWRKLKLGTPKSEYKSSQFSPSQVASPASSLKAEESARYSWKREASCSSIIEDVRIGEAIALREKAEESLRELKQELGTLVKELTTKEALVKQHQKVADEAVSGWEKAEKEVLSLKLELEAASKRKTILEDRITQLDGALKECMRQVRLVREEQEEKTLDAITSKTKECAELKAVMDAKQAELYRKLMESEAQNSAMAKSLQERAQKILETNEAKSKSDAELKVLQVKLTSAEKDISSLKYELHLLSKELQIRNEEVAYCKKSADAAHKQHLDNVQKVTKLEADCLRLRILVKKKLPGPAAIMQMRKEVEGLPSTKESTAMIATTESKRRPSRSYASNTISFSNSHQRSTACNTNRNAETLQDRLMSVEEENRLLKEALSKRINDLQASWLLCAKTANKLCIAEDHLESLQGTPRDYAKTDRSFEFGFNTTGTPSIASMSDAETGFGGPDDVEEASCAESWASALIGELAHFKREKIITKEAIKEVTESYTTKESISGSIVVNEVQHDGKPQVANDTLPQIGKHAHLRLIGDSLDIQHDLVKATSLLCEDFDDKLGQIEEMLRTSNASENEKLKGFVDAAQKTFLELKKKIYGLQSSPTVSAAPDHVAGLNDIAAKTITSTTEIDESGLDVGMPMSTMERIKATIAVTKAEKLDLLNRGTLKCQERESRMDAHPSSGPDVYAKHRDANEEYELGFSSSFSSVLSKLITLLEMLPCRTGNAMPDANYAWWDQEKQGLIACKDRFLQGQANVLEILARVGMLVCRVCHPASQDGDPTFASFINADMAARQVTVGAAVVLTPLPSKQQGEGGADKVDELDAVGKRDADVETRGITKRADELEADMAAGVKDSEGVQDDMVSVHDNCAEVDAIVAVGCNNQGDLAANVARPVDAIDAVILASKLTQMMQSEKDRLCEEGATKGAELQAAQAELAHYKTLHSQLQNKNEELQVKLQGLMEVERDDGNAVKVLNYGEGKKQTEKSDLVEAKEKLAECERTILDLGQQLYALSTTPALPRHPLVDHPLMISAPAQQQPRPVRGWSPAYPVASGPQSITRSPQPASPMRARRQRYREATDWLQQLDIDQTDSPPLSAMSSPARSPGRYTQQLSGRTSLSGYSTARTALARPAASATSSFGSRLFSRSRNQT